MHIIFQSFEHSLVEELGYDGYQRLRRAFDRSFGGQEKVPSFDLVVDAGCGTGLVGEQVRQQTTICMHNNTVLASNANDHRNTNNTPSLFSSEM